MALSKYRRLDNAVFLRKGISQASKVQNPILYDKDTNVILEVRDWRKTVM